MSDLQYHVDGSLTPASKATVSVRDRGFMYGDAAFETLRAYGGVPFEWEAHDQRLRETARTLGFEDAVPRREDLRERVEETLAANDLRDAYVRLSVTRGVQPGKLTPQEVVDPTVVVIVSPLPRGGVDGERVWDGPATLHLAETRRVPDEAIPASAKTHNYLNGILARLEGRDGTLGEGAGNASTDSDDPNEDTGGPDETLLRTLDGTLTEGATSNLFFVDDGVLHTPTTDLPVLPGITRRTVLELASECAIPVEAGRYDWANLQRATEVFVTNSTWEIRPVDTIVRGGSEGGATRVTYEPGPVTEQLQQAFDERVEALYD